MFLKIYKILNLDLKVYTKLKKIHAFLDRVFSLFEISDMRESLKNFMRDNKCLDIHIEEERYEDIASTYGIVMWHIRNIMQEKGIFIHGSSMVHGNNNIIFMGEGNSGKSTLVSSMEDGNVRILSDDITAIDTTRKTLLPFPTIPNIREGECYGLRNKYKSLFESLLKKYGRIGILNINLLSKSDFEKYFEYCKKLYDIEKPFMDYSKNKLIFVFLERRRLSSIPKLNIINVPESVKLFFKSLRTIPEIDGVMTKKLLQVFLSGEHYKLHMGGVEQTSGLLKDFFN